MELIPDKLLRDELGIDKNAPVYYISPEAQVDAMISQYESGELEKSRTNDGLEDLINKRPFDECVIISKNFLTPERVVEKTFREDFIKNSKESDIYCIVHFTEDGRFRNFTFHNDNQQFENNTVRERFNMGLVDVEKDFDRIKLNKSRCLFAITPFSVKKNRLCLSEGRTIKQGKKGKSKKQKFIYITSTVYESKKTEFNNVKCHESFEVTQVAGHPRYYRKNPETNGHDRNGNSVVGWTWVKPYPRGEGKDAEVKIRKFLK